MRQRIAEKERQLLESNQEVSTNRLEEIGKQELREYGTFTPKQVLEKERQLDVEQVAQAVDKIHESNDKVSEILALAQNEGIKNALAVIEKVGDGYVVDEAHRKLIELIKSGREIQGLKEGVPPWHILHMTLFAVSLPEFKTDNNTEKSLENLVSLMEQFFLGMQGVGYGEGKNHYTFELAVANDSEDIILYVAIPNEFINLFEKQILSLFPKAVITEQQHDYNIFVENGTHLISEAKLAEHPIYPLRTADEFNSDPLNVLLNAFSKIERDGGGAALQITINSTTTAEQVALIRGDLKYYSDSVDAYRAPVPEEVTQLVTEGRVLLKQGSQANRSGEQLAVGNLESDDISYQDGILSIGPTEIMVRSYTLEDAVLDYLINHFEPEEWVHKDRIVNWVIDELEDESKNGKSVYDKVVAINSKVKHALGTESLLFDTSRSGYIKRNY